MTISIQERELMHHGIVRPLSQILATKKEYNWSTKPSAAEFGIGTVWFNDIKSTGYSDGINWTKLNDNLLYSGKVIKNLLRTQYVSEFSHSLIAGTGTPTIVKNDTTEEITITMPAGTTGRAFISFPAMSFLAGHTYCVGFEITTLNKPSAGGANILDVVVAPTVDFGAYQLTMASVEANSRQAAIFQPTTTQSVTFRLGLGIAGNATAGVADAVVILKRIMVVDLSVSGVGILPPYVQPRQSAMFISQYNGSLTNATSGKLTLTTNTTPVEKGISIAIFGDSYVNDSGDYPEQLASIMPPIGVWYQSVTTVGVTVAGTRPNSYLTTFQTKLQRLIDDGQKPSHVLIQSSLNTINMALEADQITARTEDLLAIRTAAEWAISHNIKPILTNITAWKAGAGASWITNGKYLAQQKFDIEIYNLAAELKIPVFNLRNCVEDENTPYLIDPIYDSGDGIHPSTALGMKSIANSLYSFLTGILVDPRRPRTITPSGTVGAQTINKLLGSVNLAASATSLIVTNSLVNVNSIIQCTVGTNDATMFAAKAVAADGSFTIYPNAAPTAETRVNFTIN